MHEHEELIICEILLRQPTIHLKEIAYEIENTTGTRFPVESLCRTVHRLGFTMKKASFNCSRIIILFSRKFEKSDAINIGIALIIQFSGTQSM